MPRLALKLLFATAHAEGRVVLAMDRASVRRRDIDGHLHVRESVISAAEVSQYFGHEIPGAAGLGLNPRQLYSVLRPPDELEKATPSFAGKPLLSKHRVLTADSHARGAVVGAVMNPRFRAPCVLAELIIWDGAAIRDIEGGEMPALSAGYRYTPILERGTYKGKSYMLVMRNIQANHVALVAEPRVSVCVIGDGR